MSEFFTKSMARNIYLGGSLFFFLLLVGLTFHTMRELPARDHRENITPQVILGKRVWERHNCIGCHSLLGEGAYFAPELGNVYERLGGSSGGKANIITYLKTRQVNGIPGRRSMPQFNLRPWELDAVAEYLKWISEVNTSHWPPNIQG